MKRLRQLRISPELLMILSSGVFRVVSNPMPDSTILVRTYIDNPTGEIVLVCEDESFDLVDDGAILPNHPAPFVEQLITSEWKTIE